jgi:sterol desaturase/sphingolipid hydroxylase (fatty acid hydroxylase superfamily)
MSSIRVHPVNELVGNFCRAVPVLLLGLNPVVTATTAPLLALYAVLLHTNVDWDFGPLHYAARRLRLCHARLVVSAGPRGPPGGIHAATRLH